MRIEGRVHNGMYMIVSPHGVVKQVRLEEARKDQKLLAAIKRNSWEAIPEDDNA